MARAHARAATRTRPMLVPECTVPMQITPPPFRIVSEGNVPLLRRRLEAGDKVDAADSQEADSQGKKRRQALHYAAAQGYVAALKLLNRGAAAAASSGWVRRIGSTAIPTSRQQQACVQDLWNNRSCRCEAEAVQWVQERAVSWGASRQGCAWLVGRLCTSNHGILLVCQSWHRGKMTTMVLMTAKMIMTLMHVM